MQKTPLLIGIAFIAIFCSYCSPPPPDNDVIGEWVAKADPSQSLIFKSGNAFEMYEDGELLGTGRWEYEHEENEQITMRYNGEWLKAHHSGDIISFKSREDHPVVYTRKK